MENVTRWYFHFHFDPKKPPENCVIKRKFDEKQEKLILRLRKIESTLAEKHSNITKSSREHWKFSSLSLASWKIDKYERALVHHEGNCRNCYEMRPTRHRWERSERESRGKPWGKSDNKKHRSNRTTVRMIHPRSLAQLVYYFSAKFQPLPKPSSLARNHSQMSTCHNRVLDFNEFFMLFWVSHSQTRNLSCSECSLLLSKKTNLPTTWTCLELNREMIHPRDEISVWILFRRLEPVSIGWEIYVDAEWKANPS